MEAEGWRFVAFVRLVPLFPFNLLNYALGLTRIPLAAYVLASLVCMLPGTFVYTWLGYAGREAFAQNDAALRYGLIGLALLAAVAFLPRLLRRLRADEKPRWIDRGRVGSRLSAKPATRRSSMCADQTSSQALLATFAMRATCRLPIYQHVWPI